MTAKAAAFKVGDRVCWDHVFSAPHAAGSIIKADAVPETAKLGEVVKVANDEGTWFEVKLDSAKKGETVTLTEDELVKVADA